VSIGIYDIKGKWITSIVENHLSNGTHSFNWKGIDATGNPVSSGSYLVVLKYAGFTASKKIVF
jgi:flagellar hook assembly protein FlgD